jgi:hypothetical protein
MLYNVCNWKTLLNKQRIKVIMGRDMIVTVFELQDECKGSGHGLLRVIFTPSDSRADNLNGNPTRRGSVELKIILLN